MQEKQLQLVTYEQAKKLKELGFDWECTAFYDLNENNELDYFANQVDWNNEVDTFSAPTVALALKWFRDVKGMFFHIISACPWSKEFYECLENGEKYKIDKNKIKYSGFILDLKHSDIIFPTYAEAESALLDALLEHCEKEVKNA